MYEITCDECKKRIMLCDEMICRECYNKMSMANDDLDTENTALSNALTRTYEDSKKSKKSEKEELIKSLLEKINELENKNEAYWKIIKRL